jgi:hypothetical protein
MLIALSLAVAVTQSGRTWGIDVRLARRESRPRLPVY